MFSKLSFRIGILFLVFILIVESILFFFLYTNLANERIEEVLSGLLGRGNSHRDVLEKQFDAITLNHVALMESETDMIVVITDQNNDPIVHSNPIDQEMKKIMNHKDDIAHDGRIIADEWKKETYIATESPIVIDNKIKGYVYMFASSSVISTVLNQLSYQFFLGGLVTIFLTIITIFILTRFITIPLVRMKEATEKMAQGKLEVTLGYERNDELGQLEASIRKLAQELEKIKQERNDFLASISHELRTPLTYVKGYAEIANRENVSEEERKRYLSILMEESEHLATLVKNLFELAKMDQNQFSINKQLVRLCEPIQEVFERTQPLLEEKGIMFDIHCESKIKAWIDIDRFQQVLLNLIDNAIKHSEQGSKISILVEEIDKWVQITVEDEGEGIPANELPYIFDRLYRVEKSRSRAHGGTGLGLAIVKEIIEKHQGKIWAKSTLGKGTKMIIQLNK